MKQKFIKGMSGFLTATMILSCGISAFADTETESVTPVTEESGGEVQTPVSPVVDISINYNKISDSEYDVTITSKTRLEGYKNFHFKLSAVGEGTAISSPLFATALNPDGQGIVSANASSAEFTSTATTANGKLKLCTFKLNKAPSAETLTFAEFYAYDSEDTRIDFIPTATYAEGDLVPALSTEAQTAYDKILALPKADQLTFNGEKSVADYDTLVTEANTAYDALSQADKDNITKHTEYDDTSIVLLTELPPVIAEMKKAEPCIDFYKQLSAVDDADILKYQYLINVYNSKVKATAETASFTDGSPLATEYQGAKDGIAAKKTAADTAWGNIPTDTDGYDSKLTFIDNQLANIQGASQSAYYNDYLDDLTAQIEVIKNGITTDLQDGTLKDALLESADTKTTDIAGIKSGLNNLPTADIPALIYLGRTYELEFNRSVTPEASVKIDVYNKATGSKIDTETHTYKQGDSELKIIMTAVSNKYPADGEYVTIKCYYTVQNATKLIKSDDAVIDQVAAAITPGGFTSPGSDSWGSSDSGISGGTKFPEPDLSDDDEDIPSAPIQGEDKHFFDIDNYGWAEEAIEGLYYTGIINGMEEGVFNPAGSVTREQFCKMVVQLFGVLDYNTSTSFADVDTDAWYAPFISSAINAGYVQGQSDDYFGVGESIMRQDMVTMLYRALGSRNSSAVVDFTDNDQIAPYAEEAISEMVGLGIVNGYEDGSFKPRGTATRAEAAKMIWGVYKLLNK